MPAFLNYASQGAQRQDGAGQVIFTVCFIVPVDPFVNAAIGAACSQIDKQLISASGIQEIQAVRRPPCGDCPKSVMSL